MRNYKPLIAEFTGTFCLVFCGAGAVVVNQQTHGIIGHAGVSAVFGLIVIAMIYSFGSESGAHINPAVTIGFMAAGLFPPKHALSYILAQVAGAILASAALKVLFPANEYLGSTIPAGSALQSFVLEVILSFILMLVILKTSQGAKETGTLAGLAIGATVMLEALFGGPVSGASMNPARSIGPALVSGHVSVLWIYLIAPTLGMGAASYLFRPYRSANLS
ncbi:aquaporin [Mucilaginibacter mali]|uniref:Aquaporin n=1 Tax=Mucilaginibacter mali TaxID=2740462 RepID=A0A7D4PUZ8_9SPHI|nr:aquaporin [Mucilaginibacter mali]QKJ31208.1 aquaporin [Mucilaginibacter mali]